MTQACPISGDRVDERAGRIAALFSLLLAALFAWKGWAWAMLGLSADFALRALGLRRYSPVALLSRQLRQISGLEPRLINAGPKRFAALVGCAFTLAIAASLALHWRTTSLSLAGLLVLCAGLEAGLGFCIACVIYGRIPAGLRERIPIR